MQSENKSRFWKIYDKFSETGHCDSPGWMEYKRVKAEWIKAGKPQNIVDFIKKRANIQLEDLVDDNNEPTN